MNLCIEINKNIQTNKYLNFLSLGYFIICKKSKVLLAFNYIKDYY
jgi:hypothetical protein